jgi:hypothetical protein
VSTLEVIVSIPGREPIILNIMPGTKEALDCLLAAHRENREAILYIDDAVVLDDASRSLVRKSLFGRRSIRFPAGTIRSARLVD